MRELGEEEMNGIAGGYSPSRPHGSSYRDRPGNPANPLTVTFGTPVEPGIALPNSSPNWFFGY